MRVRVLDLPNQKKALQALVDLTEPETADPQIRNTALAIILDACDCDDHDDGCDECQARAIYEAVKHGTDAVEGLENGIRYISDPVWADFFTSPTRMLQQLKQRLGAEDCDGHNIFINALLGSVGFRAGFRAWGRTKGEYTHVYPVVKLPKNGPLNDLVALDTTVDEDMGFEPPGGFTLTALMDGA